MVYCGLEIGGESLLQSLFGIIKHNVCMQIDKIVMLERVTCVCLYRCVPKQDAKKLN